MSNEQSPPVRKVVPFKPGKRTSTFRRLQIDFAGTALEQALHDRDQQESLPQSVSPTDSASLNTKTIEGDSLTDNTSPTENISLTDNTRLTKSTILPTADSLVESVRLTDSTRLVKKPQKAPRRDSLTESVSPTDADKPKTKPAPVLDTESLPDLFSGLPNVKGHVRLFHQITDHLLPLLDPAEQAVWLQLYRLSWGFNKSTCSIGLPALAKRSGMGTTSAAQAVKRLQDKGLIKKLKMTFGRNLEQGIEYWVRPPTSLTGNVRLTDSVRLMDSGAYKDKDHDQKDKDHQSAVMMLYEDLTGNRWEADDQSAYRSVQHIPQERLLRLMVEIFGRAAARINRFGYFAKSILGEEGKGKSPARGRETPAEWHDIEELANYCLDLNADDFGYSLNDLVDDVEYKYQQRSRALDDDDYQRLTECFNRRRPQSGEEKAV